MKTPFETTYTFQKKRNLRKYLVVVAKIEKKIL